MRRFFNFAVIIAVLITAFLIVQPAFAALGFVGNMSPTSGAITVGSSFDVQIEVWKGGVTNSPGQGAGITCALHWGAVGYFGDPDWLNTTDTAMTYVSDTGNNDIYRATLTPPVGLYEYTAFCTDTTDSSTMWRTGSNGQLKVDTASGGCNGANQNDNNVYWSGLLHDSFSTAYRSPIGPVTTSQLTVTLKFRTCMDDLNAKPTIRVWDDRPNIETIANLTFDHHEADATLGSVTYWTIDQSIPVTPTILYYVFKAADGSNSAYYRDDNPAFYGGGYGQAESNQATAYDNSYQLTVYDPAFSVPNWMQRGIVYQIFPDRFRDGNVSNDPAAGRFFYSTSGGIITRSNQVNWNSTICDPRNAGGCLDHYSDNFYGGDLAGITEKIDQGYFDQLGVSVLYLNPIFRSPSNHKYDTADYLTIDPDFGSLSDFQALAATAHAHNMKIVLDGVFNHTSSDSKYFDRYNRYNAAGDLINPNGGANDGSGACESAASGFRSWYYLPDIGTPGRDNNPGSGPLALCDPIGSNTTTYESWYGYSSLPKMRANSDAVRDLIWNNHLNSVGPYWTQQGADGWRFDVGGDVDRGVTNDPANDYWEGFRAAVRNMTDTGKTDVLMMGEEWGDASAWLLGGEWDSVMNYRFRSALLSWLSTGCLTGNGCSGNTFEDNDSNASSSSGSISPISPSQFNARLRSIQEDYPPMAFKAMLNLAGSHDTNRVRYLLKKINNDSDSAALQRLKEWWLFAFTYPGAPTLYYGDEIALTQDAVWDGTRWQDDPYNRAPYPWPDASGSSYSADITLLAFARKLASIRWSYRALQDGDVQHGLIIDDANQLYGFARTTGSQTALIALNRSGTQHTATFSGLTAAPYNLSNGTILYDAIEGITYTVSGGAVSVPVNPTWGVVLLEQAKIETPAAVNNIGATVNGLDVVLRWSPVVKDTQGDHEVITAYQIHRSSSASFTPDATTLITTVTPANFGAASEIYTDTGKANQGYAYRIVAVNAAGNLTTTSLLPAVTDNRYAREVPGAGRIAFLGQTSFLTLTTPDTLSVITLTDHVGTGHPFSNTNGGGLFMLNHYYTLEAAGSGFNATLCLSYLAADVPAAVTNEAQLRLCRWTGATWACPASTAYPAEHLVCADNVTAFSDWTLGAVGPNVVTLRDLQAADRATPYAPIGLALIALIASGALLLVGRRRSTIKH